MPDLPRNQSDLYTRIQRWANANGHELTFGTSPRGSVTASLTRLDGKKAWMIGYGNTTNEALRSIEDGLIEDGHGADIAA